MSMVMVPSRKKIAIPLLSLSYSRFPFAPLFYFFFFSSQKPFALHLNVFNTCSPLLSTYHLTPSSANCHSFGNFIPLTFLCHLSLCQFTLTCHFL